MNTTLMLKELKATWKFFTIITGVMLMYIIVVISMYDPQLGKILADFEAAMPEIMAAFGMSGAGESDLIGYIASYLFGFIMILFPILLIVVLANRLVAKYVDNGSMAYLLATPNTRRKIIITQAVFLSLSVIAMLAICGIVTVIYSLIAFKGELDIGRYIALCLGTVGLHILISGLSFCVSCMSNDTKISYSISAGIPIAFYIIQMIANLGGRYENFKYATFYSLFSADDILNGSSRAVWMVLAMFAGGIVFYAAGCIRFCKRNLSI